MNEYIYKIFTWLSVNQLSLNINKTVIMTFGLYKDSVPKVLNINIQETMTLTVEVTKYLDIY